MRILKISILITSVFVLSGCKSGDAPQSDIRSTFDTPFPKRNINLSNVLGDELLLKNGTDTTKLIITSCKNNNLVTDGKTGDTLFRGTVCRFRGMYYFNMQLNDTSYWIYAVKIKSNLIYGLNTLWDQMHSVDNLIEKGLYPKLVKYQNEYDIRLHPDKRELKKLYSYIVDSTLSPDTILYSREPVFSFSDTTKADLSIDPEEMELVTKVYPNPTTDLVTIQKNKGAKLQYKLINLAGKPMINGVSDERELKLDLSTYPDGLYLLELNNPKTPQKEQVKIMKK